MLDGMYPSVQCSWTQPLPLSTARVSSLPLPRSEPFLRFAARPRTWARHDALLQSAGAPKQIVPLHANVHRDLRPYGGAQDLQSCDASRHT